MEINQFRRKLAEELVTIKSGEAPAFTPSGKKRVHTFEKPEGDGQTMFKLVAAVCLVLYGVKAYPSEPLFDFSNGGVKVNFLGYKAGAGLGGLLSGQKGNGGMFAFAETPYGQKAAAGGGGTLGDILSGGLFAGAQSGYGQNAYTGLGGVTSGQGSYGHKFANAQDGYGHIAASETSHIKSDILFNRLLKNSEK
ncbi:hypothetical protein HHI36_018638 [Cryptolaemus montrouzieri]|uniref:Uncharacterized protein n=1 Tax=Cryptolaemus montrouzieri TaxID=559131 RepID=A0ABD2P0P1_9CUCU